MPKWVLTKRNLFCSSQGLSSLPPNYQAHAQPSSQFMFLDNIYTSKNIYLLITPKTHH